MELNPKVLAAIGLFVGAQACIIAASFVTLAMVDEVNRKLPEQQKLGYLGWHFFKYRKLANEYRRLYPGGHLTRYCHRLAFCGFTLFAVFASRHRPLPLVV